MYDEGTQTFIRSRLIRRVDSKLDTKLVKVDGLVRCVVRRRLNRFTVQVEIKGELYKAHITNTGRLQEFIKSGNRGVLVPINGAKLLYRLIGVKKRNYYALIDTRLQNSAFEIMIDKGLIPWLRGFKLVKRNPRVGDSLLDFMLVDENGEKVFIETKSAVLEGNNGEAMYPDCPTERGRRHILRIIEMRKKGINAMIVFISGLRDALCFKPYDKGDPMIPELLRELYILDSSSIRAISIYLSLDGWIRLKNPNLGICADWPMEV